MRWVLLPAVGGKQARVQPWIAGRYNQCQMMFFFKIMLKLAHIQQHKGHMY